MDKERLERIGKFLNDRMIIHRNVENNTLWTTEEKMIQELYDNYLYLLIKYKEQKEAIDKAIAYIKENLIVSSILDGKKYYCLNEYGFDYKELLQILEDKEVSE